MARRLRFDLFGGGQTRRREAAEPGRALTMILFDLLLWLGVIGYSLRLVVCVVARLFGLDNCPTGPPRDSRRRVGNNGRRPSDSLPVVLFPWVDRAGREVRGIRQAARRRSLERSLQNRPLKPTYCSGGWPACQEDGHVVSWFQTARVGPYAA